MEDAGLLQFVVVERIPFALLVVLGAWVLVRAGSATMEALAERFTSRRLVFKQVTSVGRFAVWIVVTLLVAASVLTLSDQVVLALGGSAAVAVGFAFKDLIASLMAGLILLFDRPFQVGDRVSFGDTYGEVVEIGLRAVRIVTLDDNLVSIPNSLFLTDVVSSANSGALDQQCVFDFWIGCLEDIALASEIVFEAAITSNYVFLKKPVRISVREGPVPDGAERLAILVRVKAYVLDGRHETAFGTDVTERVKRAFRERGVFTAGELEWVSRAGMFEDQRT